MQSVISWVTANFQSIVVALLAIDAALIPLFPNAGILGKIQQYLSDAKSL